MIIEKIRIHNFGPFYGAQEIAFGSGGEGVHVIRGNNGQGKTSIQRAILWCLYGEVRDRKGNPVKPTSLLNRTAYSDDTYDFNVALFLKHDNKNMSIMRKMSASAHKDKKYSEGMELQVVRDGEVLPDGENEIQRLLPREVSRFFFFDGEMLRDYEELLEEDAPSTKVLRDSIEQILGIPILRTAKMDLEEVRHKVELERGRMIRKLGGKEYDDLANDILEVQEGIKTSEQRIKGLEKEIESSDIQIAEEKRKLNSIRFVQELTNKRTLLETTIASLGQQRDGLVKSRKELVSGLYKKVLVPVAENLTSVLDKKHRETMQKYDEKRKLEGIAEQLRQGIQGSVCKTCGTVLNEKNLNNFKVQLQETEQTIRELTQVPEPNLEFYHDTEILKKIIAEGTDRTEFKKLDDEISRIDYEIASRNSKLSEISEKLVGLDVEEPRNLEISIQRIGKEQGRLKGLKEKEEEDLSGLYEVKSDLEQKIRNIPKKELRQLEALITEISRISKVFNDAISEYREQKKSEVEAEATKIFNRLKSKSEFTGLEINDRYGLSITTSIGVVLDRAEWRSAGEEQIVALSLIGALNECSGAKAPVFMDTPFGRLDLTHSKRVMEFLPSLSDQVVLLVTDKELRLGEETALIGKIKTDLTVEHKGEEEGSIIKKTKLAEVA